MSFTALEIYVILLNIFVFVVFVFLLIQLIKGQAEKNVKETGDITKRSIAKSYSLIETANTEAQGILNETRQASEQLISRLKEVSTVTKDEIESNTSRLLDVYTENLNNLNTKLLDAYKKVLEKEGKEELHDLENLSENIQKEAEANLEQFSKAVREKTDESKVAIDKFFADEMAAARDRVNRYEQIKYEEIQREASTLIDLVVKDVFGTEVTLEDKERLVMSAISKFKSELKKN